MESGVLRSSRPGTVPSICKAKFEVKNMRVTRKVMKAVDKKRLIIECGDAAYLLFDYWLSVSGQYDGVLTDTKAAQNLGWKTTKVKRVREKLQRFGWYKATKYPAANDGTRMIRYDLGKVEKPGDLQESFNRSVFKKVKPNLKQHSQTEENAA